MVSTSKRTPCSPTPCVPTHAWHVPPHRYASCTDTEPGTCQIGAKLPGSGVDIVSNNVSVGRHVATFWKICGEQINETGQCTPNTETGSWFSLPVKGQCAPGVSVRVSPSPLAFMYSNGFVRSCSPCVHVGIGHWTSTTLTVLRCTPWPLHGLADWHRQLHVECRDCPPHRHDSVPLFPRAQHDVHRRRPCTGWWLRLPPHRRTFAKRDKFDHQSMSGSRPGVHDLALGFASIYCSVCGSPYVP